MCGNLPAFHTFTRLSAREDFIEFCRRQASRLVGYYCSSLIQIVGFTAPWSYQKLLVAVQQNAQKEKCWCFCFVSNERGVYKLEVHSVMKRKPLFYIYCIRYNRQENHLACKVWTFFTPAKFRLCLQLVLPPCNRLYAFVNLLQISVATVKITMLRHNKTHAGNFAQVRREHNFAVYPGKCCVCREFYVCWVFSFPKEMWKEAWDATLQSFYQLNDYLGI